MGPKTRLDAVTKKPFPPPPPGIEHRSTIPQPCQCTDYVIPDPPWVISGPYLKWQQLRGHFSSSHVHHIGLFTGDKVKVNLSIRAPRRHLGKQRYNSTQPWQQTEMWSVSRTGSFHIRWKKSVTYRVGGQEHPSVGLDTLEKRDVSCPCPESSRDSWDIQPVLQSLHRLYHWWWATETVKAKGMPSCGTMSLLSCLRSSYA